MEEKKDLHVKGQEDTKFPKKKKSMYHNEHEGKDVKQNERATCNQSKCFAFTPTAKERKGQR